MVDRTFRPLRALAACLAVAVLFVSCRTPYAGLVHEKDGKQYGVTSGFIWRSTWWNFYERGQSYADGGYLDDAVKDFRWAIERREADQRMARTYGMHFLDDYFPHRELGIALFRQGNLEEAETELLLSLGQTESARAKFYLNAVRRGLLAREGKLALPGPRIEIDPPGERGATREPAIWVTGRVRSDRYVSSIHVIQSDSRGWSSEIDHPLSRIELAEKEITFRAEVPLASGENHVSVVATDLMGEWSQAVVAVTADRDGPAVAIEDIREIAGTRDLEFVGVVRDASAIAEVQVGAARVSPPAGGEGKVSLTIARPADGRIPFHADDVLGNRTEGTIVLQARTASSRRDRAPRGVLLASLGLPRILPWLGLAQADGVGGERVGVGEGEPRRSSSPNELLWKLGERVKVATDQYPPVIRLDGFGEPQTVYLDRVFLTGIASDEVEVSRIEVNGMPAVAAPGKRVFFSTTIPLQEGENEIRVAAVDASGKRTEKGITVIRKRPAIEDMNVRLALAPLPFKQGEGVGDLSELLQGALLDALVEQRRYRVVERVRLAEIVQELSLSALDLTREDAGLRVGELSAADAIVMGKVYERPGSLEAWARLVDTETSQVLAIEDIYGEEPDVRQARGLMAGLAQKLASAIPIVEGAVIEVDGDRVTMDKGTRDLAGSAKREGQGAQLKVAVFRRGATITNPVTGRLLGVNFDEVARGRLVSIEEARSRAAVAPLDKAPSHVQPNDLMVVR